MVVRMGTFVRTLAVVAAGLVIIGFAMFAFDELDRGSKTQQQKLAEGLGDNGSATISAPSPSPEEEKAREAAHNSVREVIDDANDVLLAPFGSLFDSDNAWVHRGVPALLALLLYGGGLGMLANALPKHRAHGGDWRTASS